MAALTGGAASAQTIHLGAVGEPSGDWNDPTRWSQGVPTSSVDAVFNVTASANTINLPPLGQSAATARSLLVTSEANYTSPLLTGGTLVITPLALQESLRVGVPSTVPTESRTINLNLRAATLHTSALATIGKGSADGAGGWLDVTVELRSSAWLHPAGLIELGSIRVDGSGQMIATGRGAIDIFRPDPDVPASTPSFLAGSLLAGAAVDPDLKIYNGRVMIDVGSSARFSTMDLLDPDLDKDLFRSPEAALPNVGSSLIVLGNLHAQSLQIGGIIPGMASVGIHQTTAPVSRYATMIGSVILDQGSWLTLQGGSSLTSETLNIRKGRVQMQSWALATIGTGEPGNQVLKAGQETGQEAVLMLAAESQLIVQGSADLGQGGTARLTVENASMEVADVTYLASGIGNRGAVTAVVEGVQGSLRSRQMELGYSYFAEEYGSNTNLPQGHLTIRSGAKVELVGSVETPGLTVFYGGDFMVGRGGTVVMETGGRMLFADPAEEVDTILPPRLTNYGTLRGGADGSAPGPGQDIHLGAHAGELRNRGTLAPGNWTGAAEDATGWLRIAGKVWLEAAGRVEMELAGTTRGTGHDVLALTGDVTAGGTLAVTLAAGFTPSAGQSFDLLDFDASRWSGRFATLSLPALPEGLFWHTSSLYNTGTLVVSSSPDPNGDDDEDGLTLAQETALGTNPNLADTDADTFQDGAEVEFGGNPLSAASTPPLKATLTHDAITANVHLRFPSRLGWLYGIYGSVDLISWWQLEGGTSGTGATLSRSYPQAPDEFRFYRVIEF